MHRRMSALFVALTLAIAVIVEGQERFGTLTGRVVDQQNTVIPGVTVVTTNTESGEVRTFVTDTEGRFTAPDLVPGRYTVRFELTGFSKVERPDVSVVLGRTFEIDAQLRVGELTEVVQVTGESTPLVDNRSTLIAHNVSAEEFDRLPKGRSFQSIALTAPSVNQGEIEGGLQVNGASGSENAFTVDGVVTNSLVNGQSRQNTVFEYLQEVQVKTSGIAAEYGGALGGVISAVTKSGGNTFRGEAHYFFEGSGLAAGPVKRLVLDPVDDRTVTYVQDSEQPAKQNEFGGSLGGPIVKDRLFFYGAYSPRNENATNSYAAADGDLDVERNIWRQQAFGKLSYTQQRLTAHWSTLWTPTKADGTLSSYNGATPNAFVGSLSSLTPQLDRGYEINQVNTNGTVDLSLSNAAFLRFRGGYFHDRYSDIGIPLVTSYTYQTPTTPLNAILPPALQGGTNVAGVNTPRAQITDFDLTKRSTFDLDYNHSFSLSGYHTLKAGYGFQHTVNDINSFYPGGYTEIFWDRSFTFNGVTTGRGLYGYYAANDRAITNKAGSDIHSLYIQDQWTVGNRLTLNLGLRSEHEAVPTFRPDIAKNAFEFGFGEKLAPRLGAAYDLRGDGQSKVFGSWGRYYDWTKYQLPRGSFGAETWCIYYRGLDTLDARHPEHQQPAGPGSLGEPGELPRSPRALVPERDRSRNPADVAGQPQPRLRAPAESRQRAHGPLHPQRPARHDRGHRIPERAGRRRLPDWQPGPRLDGGAVRDRRHAARTADASRRAPVRRARTRRQPAVGQQLVPVGQLHAEPPLWQLLRHRQLRRDHDADDRTDVGDRPAAARLDRQARIEREPRVGSRRAPV